MKQMRFSYEPPNPFWKSVERWGALGLSVFGVVTSALCAAFIWWGSEAVQAKDVTRLKEEVKALQSEQGNLSADSAAFKANSSQIFSELKDIREDVRLLVKHAMKGTP